MVKDKRDNFTPTTKRILAERVAYHCSFPGCNKSTVGPHNNDHKKRTCLGEAAHIHAASPGGARYNKHMHSEERRSIENGIWLCRNHAGLIDSDECEYTAETIRQWKQAAESKASSDLVLSNNASIIPDPTTLVQIGYSNIFEGRWSKIEGNLWTFTVCNILEGNMITLRNLVIDYAQLADNEKFLIVESQADARIISNIFLDEKQSKFPYLQVQIEPKPPTTNPNKMIDISLNISNGVRDISFTNGDFTMVKGTECAIQTISTVLSTQREEWYHEQEAGSELRTYYLKYKSNQALLNRILKMELIRLSLIPILTTNKEYNKPSLNFIKFIHSLEIKHINPQKDELIIELDLEWADVNHTRWQGQIPIFV